METNFDNIVDSELEKKVIATVEYIKSLLPEGRLRESIKYKKNEDMDYTIYTNVEYAPFVEFGTGIYGSKKKPITPKNSEALRFEIDDKVIFAKSVRGQKGQFFFREGYEYLKGVLSGKSEVSRGFAKRYFNRHENFTRRYFSMKNRQ